MGGAPSLILPNLWLGGQDVINDERFFESRNIGYVLSLGPAAPPPRIPFAGREHINIADMPQADLGKHLTRAVRFIAEGRHTNNRCVYVHCAAGISRSTTCVCAYLMVHLGISFHEALSFIISKRRAVCPNEGFTRQLKRFENSKERADLAEELARACRNYQEIRSCDLAELSPLTRPSGAEKGGQAARQGGGGGTGNTSSPRRASAPPPRDRRGGLGMRQTPLASVEQQAQQNALIAVRGAVSQYARDNASARKAGNQEADNLHIGNGDAKGDVGLSWLLRPLSDNGGLPAAGRPSGSSRSPAQPYGPPPARRNSNSQPAGRRPPAYRR